MSKDRLQLDYARASSRSPASINQWLAWVSCAIGVLNWIWIAAAVFLGGGSMPLALESLAAFGALASAPIGLVLGLKTAWGSDRVQLGHVGAVLNLLPTCYALIVVV